MSKLPSMVYEINSKQYTTKAFKGYDHNVSSSDGNIWDEKNICTEYYPALGTRKARWIYDSLFIPNGMYCHDGIYTVDGTKFYADGVEKFTVANNKKTFCSLGSKIIMLPDKKYYDTSNQSYGSIESSVSNQAVTIQDGTYAGEEAEANTIHSETITWSTYFNVGDAVTISGCTVHTDNNQTIIIREIDGGNLRFYENSFTISEGGDTESSVSVARTMPDLDFICENENRLWGCKGDTIYASKLGDPFNWNVFDGLSTDSYAVTVGSAGDFTAATSYLGYPVFFKEEHIYKVYGTKPSDFQVMSSASRGVEAGSSKSLAIAGEALFYLSRVGIEMYSGGTPVSIAMPFGDERYKNAIAGSDGIRYYVSLQDNKNKYHLFVYDTRYGLWSKEDDIKVLDFGWNSELYFLTDTGKIFISGNARSVPAEAVREKDIPFMIETGDFTENSPNMKGSGKISLRFWMGGKTTVKIKVMYDSSDVWNDIGTVATQDIKRSVEFPFIPRRNDHMRFKFEGVGSFILMSLTRTSYPGSTKQ